MKKTEKILPIIMGIVGIVIIVDVFLEQFFNIGTKQNRLTLIYCISIVLLTTQYKGMIKNKFVMIPLYIMILQTIYSLITTYVLV
tara:strand:+ start:603 stop:857 length:255 start_codon:yes stop_codon:yes gene_type:complete